MLAAAELNRRFNSSLCLRTPPSGGPRLKVPMARALKALVPAVQVVGAELKVPHGNAPKHLPPDQPGIAKHAGK
jgi:hypothetical protein